jgi:low temperature requirement protein LtrA
MSTWKNGALLRVRDGREAKVSFGELFFDLVYVFAVTQISHLLLGHLSLAGAAQALVLWFAVWLGWQYTAWVTNWFDPDKLQIRLMLFAIMVAALVMAAALPHAFEELGLVFALCYVAIQVGRTLFVLLSLGSRHELAPNFQRILGWVCISAAFWIGGALVEGPARLVFWAIAVACEYFSPMLGFLLPGLGRSRTSDWSIEGGHLAERCQLFMIVALGESILVSGASLSHHAHWDAPTVIAFFVAFLSSLAMWWVYFDTSSKAGSHAIAHSDDPGRVGSFFHYVHVIMVGGVIVSAVASELIIGQPDGRIDATSAAVLIAGPLLYLLGNAFYKRAVYGRLPLSHLAGLAMLVVLIPLAFLTDLLMVGGLTMTILIVVAVWESRSRRTGNMGSVDI